MDILTHEDGLTWKDIQGTSYKITLNADYETLVETFGQPTKGDEYKTDVEWYVNVSVVVDGVELNETFTIYNWKDGVNYLGKVEGKLVETITDWHIGCKSGSVIEVEDILDKVLPDNYHERANSLSVTIK